MSIWPEVRLSDIFMWHFMQSNVGCSPYEQIYRVFLTVDGNHQLLGQRYFPRVSKCSSSMLVCTIAKFVQFSVKITKIVNFGHKCAKYQSVCKRVIDLRVIDLDYNASPHHLVPVWATLVRIKFLMPWTVKPKSVEEEQKLWSCDMFKCFAVAL